MLIERVIIGLGRDDEDLSSPSSIYSESLSFKSKS